MAANLNTMNSLDSNNTQVDKLSVDQVIALLDIMETEWIHRNNLLWSQVFKLFYFSIFIMALPIISGGMGLNMPKLSRLLFPGVGIIAAFFSYYMSLSYAIRLRASRDTINRLMSHLPEEYRVVSIRKLPYGKFFARRQTYVIPSVLFMVELVVAFIIIYCIHRGLLPQTI